MRKAISGDTSGSSDCEMYDMANMLQRQIFQFPPGRERLQQILCGQVVACGRLKTIEHFKQSSLKVVVYERWSLTRGSKYSGLTRKLSVFWKSGRLREVVAHKRIQIWWFRYFGKVVGYFGKVVAYERWSQRKVRLYFLLFFSFFVLYCVISLIVRNKLDHGLTESKRSKRQLWSLFEEANLPY